MRFAASSSHLLFQDDGSFEQTAVRDAPLPSAGIDYADRTAHNHIATEKHVTFHLHLLALNQGRRPTAEPDFQLVNVPVVTAIKLNDDLPVLSLRVLHHLCIVSQHICIGP